MKKNLRIIPILFLIITLFLPACGSNDMRNAAQVLGKEPVRDAVLLENQSDALIFWLKKGYKGMTVVHVSARDDFEFIPEEKIDKIKKLSRNKKFDELAGLKDTGEKSLFTGSNYLYSAAKLGVVKEIYWVIPFRILEFSDAERRAKAYFKTAASVFPSKDIDGMKLKGGCLKGKLFKTQVSICNIDTLPPVKGSIIFDIDADFLPAFSSDRGSSILRGFKEFFDAMNRRQLRVVSVNAALSETGNFLKPVQGYISSQIVEAVKNPQLLNSPDPPELWTIRDNANSIFLRGEWKELVEFLREPLKKYPEEPSLIMFKAVAQAHLGRYGEALNELAGLCGRDKTYCGGIIYAGQELTGLKKFNEAELFFKKTLELKHKWGNAMMEYADMLYKKGDYQSALRLYNEVEGFEDGMYLQMYIGDCYYNLDKRDDAFRHYDKGLSMFHEMIRYDLTEKNKAPLIRMQELCAKRDCRVQLKKIKHILGVE